MANNNKTAVELMSEAIGLLAAANEKIENRSEIESKVKVENFHVIEIVDGLNNAMKSVYQYDEILKMVDGNKLNTAFFSVESKEA